MLHASGTRGEWVQCCSFFLRRRKDAMRDKLETHFFSKKKSPHSFSGWPLISNDTKKISFFLQASFLSLFSSSEYPKTTTFLELDDRQAWKRTSLSKAYAPSFHIFQQLQFFCWEHTKASIGCVIVLSCNMCVNWDIETRLLPAKWKFSKYSSKCSNWHCSWKKQSYHRV